MRPRLYMSIKLRHGEVSDIIFFVFGKLNLISLSKVYLLDISDLWEEFDTESNFSR